MITSQPLNSLATYQPSYYVGYCRDHLEVILERAHVEMAKIREDDDEDANSDENLSGYPALTKIPVVQLPATIHNSQVDANKLEGAFTYIPKKTLITTYIPKACFKSIAQPARQVQADEQPAIAPNRTNNVNTSRFGKHDKNATDALQHTI
ncbi:hypothetical protein Tco_1508674, partial [Tanacetum coccineum]